MCCLIGYIYDMLLLQFAQINTPPTQLLPCRVVPWEKKKSFWQQNLSGCSCTQLSLLQISPALSKKKKLAKLENPVWVWQMSKNYTFFYVKMCFFFSPWITSYSHSREECPSLPNCPRRRDKSKLKSTIQSFSLVQRKLDSPRFNLLTLSLFSLKHQKPIPVGKHELLLCALYWCCITGFLGLKVQIFQMVTSHHHLELPECEVASRLLKNILRRSGT